MATTSRVHEAFEGGTVQPFFFNGRLLTATDLREQQSAQLERARRLGRAIGAGIVEGFAVTGTGTRGLRVTLGIAINALGDALRLPSTVRFNVLPAPLDAPARSSFANCEHTPKLETPAGTYMLVASPAIDYDGAVDMVGVESGTGRCGCCGGSSKSKERECGHRWEREGVAFELLPMTDLPVDAKDDRYRNLVAYWCLGEDGPNANFRVFADGLARVKQLLPQHVPLAVLRLGDSVEWIDNWAAKRPTAATRAVSPWSELTTDLAAASTWNEITSDLAEAHGVARFLEFQDHLDSLAASANAATLKIKEYLRYLPPAGVVPLRSANVKPAVGSATPLTGIGKFELPKFFEGVTVALHDEATLEELRLALERSWRADATDLTANPKLDLYLVNVRTTTTDLDLADAFRQVINENATLVYDELDDNVAAGSAAAVDVRNGINKLKAGALPDTDVGDLITGLLAQLSDANKATLKKTLTDFLDLRVKELTQNELWALFVRRPRDLFTMADTSQAKTPSGATDFVFATNDTAPTVVVQPIAGNIAMAAGMNVLHAAGIANNIHYNMIVH